MSYQYGKEKYRDFHWNKWSQLSSDQKAAFGGTKDDYAAYRQKHGLDGFKSAKDKARSYQFDKRWSGLEGSGYWDLHTKEQHAYHRELWQNNKDLDWDSTSDAYKMMVDKNLHSTWYKGGSEGGSEPTTGSNTTGNPQPPEGHDAPKPIDTGVTMQPQPNNNSSGGNKGGGGNSSHWDIDWGALGGTAWRNLSDSDKQKWGERWQYAAHLMGAPKWDKLDPKHQAAFGDKATYAAWKTNYKGGADGGGEQGGGGDKGGSGGNNGGGGGDGSTTVVVEGGNGGLTFEEQKALQEAQWEKDAEAREEERAYRAEQSKKDRISAIIEGMNAGKSNWSDSVSSPNGANFNSGFVQQGREKWRPR